jgi:TonB-dependent receptor
MTPDATSSDALKRVTGLSVVDNKYIFVRGVTDRYNETALNGVTVTSTDTDTDKKSFSFDLIPASLISNTVVLKSATPDLPGDFSGGFVRVNTLEFPERRVIDLSVEVGSNEYTTGKENLRSVGSDTDWLGYDDGSREFPAGKVGNDLARSLPNNWAPVQDRARPNTSYQASFGDRFQLGENEFGIVAAGTYKQKSMTSDVTESPTYKGTPIFYFDGTHYDSAVMWGGLLNLNYKVRGLHKFSVKTNYIQTGNEEVTYSEGQSSTSELLHVTTLSWKERTLQLGQLSGEHLFPRLGDLEWKWRLHASKSKASEPDRKHVEFERDPWGYFAFRDNYRTWSDLDEEKKGFDTDFMKPVGDAKLKAGIQYSERVRDYNIEAWSTDPSSVRYPNYGIIILPIDTVFSADNYGPNKFTFIPVSVFTGVYDGSHTLKSGFAMVDWPFFIGDFEFRFAGGMRYEDSEQLVNTVEAIDDPTPKTTRLDNKDWLPSANFTWVVTDDTNFRLAYYESVNRPEFRELANVLYYDFGNFQNVIGNPKLRRAYVKSFDVRWETFPDIGEVVAASFFYKDFTDAIEEVLIPAPERYTKTWFNSPRGKNYGFEIEARKTLGWFIDYMDNFTFTGNYTWVDSEIEYTETKTDAEGNPIVKNDTRQMQGQSPWSVNLSLTFQEPTTGTGFSVLYNKVGRRLSAVGDSRDQDVYEEPRNLVDLAVTQRLFDRLRLKFAMKNVLGEDMEFTSGPEEATHRMLALGTTYQLSISFNF